MTDPAPSSSSTRPYAAFATAVKADDQRLAEQVAEILDMTMPPECAAGVAANIRLLETHWATLRKASAND